MQPTSQVAAIVGGVIALLLIAIVVLAVTRRLKLPFTVVLVLIGIDCQWEHWRSPDYP
jgi:hypothetical protein